MMTVTAQYMGNMMTVTTIGGKLNCHSYRLLNSELRGLPFGSPTQPIKYLLAALEASKRMSVKKYLICNASKWSPAILLSAIKGTESQTVKDTEWSEYIHGLPSLCKLWDSLIKK